MSAMPSSDAASQLASALTPTHGPERKRLPSTRVGMTRKWELNGVDLYITVNFYDCEKMRTKPAEIFCKVGKLGDVTNGLVEGLTTTISLALQYGVPWPVIASKFEGTKFGQGDDQASSYLDALAKAVNQIIKERRDIIGED